MFNGIQLFSAIREKLREGYGFHDFRADVMAGIVVGMVAIPLGMALAIASGVPPQHGLYTVIIAGFAVALCGGSRFQVTGPTAAFVVILAPIANKFGIGGLLTAGLMAGIILFAMGASGLGKFIQFIPYPVTTGFTSGIAVVIATLQLKDFLGLHMGAMPDRFVEKLIALVHAMPSIDGADVVVGCATLALLVLWPRVYRRIPAPLVALTAVSVGVVVAKSFYPELHIATIGSRFSYVVNGAIGHGIPQALPHILFPWQYATAGGPEFTVSLHSIEALVPAAFAIALLGAVESLLSAVVADGMAHTKHNPDAELMALGIGNIMCPFFGGVAATGAIARTATNIRFGARSPLSAIIHAAFVLLVILFCAPLVSYVPMAALSALLLLVAYNMSEIRHFRHIIQVGPRSDVAVLLICFALTITFDMVIGVTAGVMMAALLFMKRMATMTSSHIMTLQSHPHHAMLPPDMLLYDINGPLFFGAAEKAMEAIDAIQDNVKHVCLLMEDVPVMDVSGLVALESALDDLMHHHRQIYLIGVKPQPREILLRSPVIAKIRPIFCPTIEDAIAHAHAA